MINAPKLKGLIAERGYSQQDVASYIGITGKTFYAKMKTGNFYLSEIDKIVEMLGIDNPTPFFFKQLGSDK